MQHLLIIDDILNKIIKINIKKCVERGGEAMADRKIILFFIN